MASREAISKVRIGKTTTYRKGTDTELLAFGSEAAMAAKLLVLGDGGGGRRQVFRAGRLSVHMIRVASSPVCLVSCMVGDHQWTLARDEVVLRAAPSRYAFAMPGFCYGLSLPCSGGAYEHEYCRTLEEMLLRFCAFRCLEGVPRPPRSIFWFEFFCYFGARAKNKFVHIFCIRSGTSFACGGDQSGDVWARAYEEIKKLTYATVTVDPSSSREGLDSIQLAVRTSAVVKLLSRSLLTGALDPRKHLDLTAGTSLPSGQIIADLLDVIETGRRREPSMPPTAATPSGLWCINAEGLKLLLVVLSACSTAEKRKRQQLETLNEGEEEPEEAGGDDDAGEKGGGGGGGSSAATPSRCISGGARVEKEMDVY
ncbi:hypothetical protein ZIOFF_014383 [Zingiber officinale]|uniref:Uncharacterized protein n=1 Tax=Zingiber officinale TaxID=94328 RepID=A0A8J5LRT8_ZINOF|nr:hypothetical protein ZIOFF_014383 [Zingiber officinale]